MASDVLLVGSTLGGVLVGVDDVGAMLEEEAGHRRNDAGTVPAGDEEASNISLFLVGQAAAYLARARLHRIPRGPDPVLSPPAAA
jgi:hypothetical protein